MNAERWKSIENHFHNTLELPREEQLAFIKKLGKKDPSLAQAVEKLLASHYSSDAFLNSDVIAEHNITIGRRIGPWEIIRQIGKGGMSTVYLAERADGHFERQVAIKFLHGMMPGQDMHRRILQEQQILARLLHKNIAQLQDAGITDEGRPYFILEYVDGIPVTRWCEENQIDINGRLRVFTQICEAVQYAHQRLVVHRDLKPSNILVKKDGTVKLLDFGIAKLLDDTPADGTPHTRTGLQLMTPEYASPEQVNGELITTSTDVYALGLLLCEILTGKLPFTFQDKMPFEIAGIITGTPPTKPSTLIAPKNETSQTAARSSQPAHFRKKLKGDLDNIILKALRKDPARRYGSAEQLLKDIEHYQNHLPVSARPESIRYRTGKFLARHKVGVAAAFIVISSLIATASVSLWQAEQARSEQNRTQKINEFLQVILTEADPYEAGADATIRDVLHIASDMVGERFSGEPDIEAPLRYTIGYTQLNLMELDGSLVNLQRAEFLFKQLYGDSDARTLITTSYIYWLQYEKGRYNKAVTGYRSLIDQLQADHHWDLHVTLYNDLGVILSELERYDEALEIQYKVLEIWENNDTSQSDYAVAHTNIGYSLHGLMQLEQAEEYYRKSLRLHRQHYPDELHPDLAAAINNLGVLLKDKGNYDEALPMYEESLRIRQATLGTEHTSTGHGHLNLGRILVEMNRMDEARFHLERTEEIANASLGEQNIYTQMSRMTLGYIYIREGDPAEAVRLISDAIAVLRTIDAPAWIIEQAENWLAEIMNP